VPEAAEVIKSCGAAEPRCSRTGNAKSFMQIIQQMSTLLPELAPKIELISLAFVEFQISLQLVTPTGSLLSSSPWSCCRGFASPGGVVWWSSGSPGGSGGCRLPLGPGSHPSPRGLACIPRLCRLSPAFEAIAGVRFGAKHHAACLCLPSLAVWLRDTARTELLDWLRSSLTLFRSLIGGPQPWA